MYWWYTVPINTLSHIALVMAQSIHKVLRDNFYISMNGMKRVEL